MIAAPAVSTKMLDPSVGSVLRVPDRVRERGGEQESAQPKAIVVIEQWICVILGLVCMVFGIWGFYEARTGCSFCIHCMAGIAIYADVASNGSRLHRIGCSTGTLGVGASMIGFRFPAAEDYCDLLAGLELDISASVLRSINYPRIRIRSVHCDRNHVGTTSILTFAPSGASLTLLRAVNEYLDQRS